MHAAVSNCQGLHAKINDDWIRKYHVKVLYTTLDRNNAYETNEL